MHTLKKVWNILTWLLVLLTVTLAVLLVGVRIVGLTPYVVLSGSMEPTYMTGGMIYVKTTTPEQIEVGDPITFVMNDNLVIATHRVVDINEAERFFTTKGDANDSADGAPVRFENLVGKPILHLPYLGYISNFLTNPPEKYIAWGAIGILLILMFFPELIKCAGKAKFSSHKSVKE